MVYRRCRASWRSGAWVLAAGVASFGTVLGGCQAPIIYSCQRDADCVAADGTAGVCEASAGFCSFADPTCPSGSRFSKHAGDGLSGDCTTLPGQDESTTSSSTVASWPEPSTTEPNATVADSESDDSTSGGTGPGPAGSATETCVLEELVFVATVAECTDPFNNDPQQCESYAGDGHILVDSSAMNLGDVPFTAFLAFEFGPALVDVQAVRLELTVSPDAASDSTGEVWQVGSFSIPDLYVGQPMQVGNAPVAGDLGSIGGGEIARFDLSPLIVENSQNLFVGLFPLSSDGLQYENLRSDPPRHPKLVVVRCQG